MFIININGLYFLTQGVSVQYLFIKFKDTGLVHTASLPSYSLPSVISINPNSTTT